MSKGLIIAIDGPAGSGKSTSAKLIAKKLGYLYIDTGAMYRAVAFAAIRQGVDPDEEDAVAALARAVENVLAAGGDASPVVEVRSVGGGDINQAARVETAGGRYFVKWHPAPQPDMFTCEAKGLALLAAAGAARVYRVLALRKKLGK